MNPKLLSIDHVQLAMPAGGEDRARRFYGEILGLPERPKPPHLAARGGAWFERDHLKVHLGIDPAFAPARKAHVAFAVADLAELTRELRAAGCEITESSDAETRQIYIHDPFGNRLEFIEQPVK